MSLHISAGKGFWATLGVGDFYYELAIQIVEVCMATNHRNGGNKICFKLLTRHYSLSSVGVYLKHREKHQKFTYLEEAIFVQGLHSFTIE